MKFDDQILEAMFDIVLKFHDQTLSVVEVITIPVIILKRHAVCLFIGRTNNYTSPFKNKTSAASETCIGKHD